MIKISLDFNLKNATDKTETMAFKAIGGGLTIFLGQKMFLGYQKLDLSTVQTLFTEWKKKIVFRSYDQSKLGQILL